MIFNQIYKGICRLIFGSTSKYTIRKGSCSLSGASWIPIFREMTENPMKIVSIEFITENDINSEYRIIVNGEKIFPFCDFSQVRNGITSNFILPIEIAANEYVEIEVRGTINAKNVVILDELAVIEVI